MADWEHNRAHIFKTKALVFRDTLATADPVPPAAYL
jgi:hypothetical protein